MGRQPDLGPGCFGPGGATRLRPYRFVPVGAISDWARLASNWAGKVGVCLMRRGYRFSPRGGAAGGSTRAHQRSLDSRERESARPAPSRWRWRRPIGSAGAARSPPTVRSATGSAKESMPPDLRTALLIPRRCAGCDRSASQCQARGLVPRPARPTLVAIPRYACFFVCVVQKGGSGLGCNRLIRVRIGSHCGFGIHKPSSAAALPRRWRPDRLIRAVRGGVPLNLLGANYPPEERDPRLSAVDSILRRGVDLKVGEHSAYTGRRILGADVQFGRAQAAGSGGICDVDVR